jgi:Domain of unknown function (DUF4149)
LIFAAKTCIRKAFGIVFVLWAGSLWSLALWVAPTLFAQGDRHLAGVLAARLFTIETYVGLAAAGFALALPDRARFAPSYLAAALLAANEWMLKPVMNRAHTEGAVLGLSFGAWHGVAALLYVLACLAVLWLVWRDHAPSDSR